MYPTQQSQFQYRPDQYVAYHHPHQQYQPPQHNFHYQQPQVVHESNVVPPDPFSSIEPMETTVQPKEQILEEIVRECEEIERRSNSSDSPVSNWSSDEQDGPSSVKSYHPYKTPEKKERKKAQNRLAATRYREKKRREKEEAMTCIEGLSVTNSKLKDQVSELEREVRYFKKFMLEMGMKNLEIKI
ncbi:hypothetical protein GCK72_025635 [Caenorhabditis remanei]|uniref:BZIP domain-containing protein n=1 Tax=Caenorhabditis remanei TaxID=31234 RepID=A0A6A5G2I2_CAERE|nr:hypothetical protein GCK72_025635 [Caenorhabditis remanei]KAF1749168.1 hypothetical protein GCK72_025635 [Caenorhabditis remanei]